MKSWHSTLLYLLTGMIASAVLFLVASPPRDTSVVLLPVPTPAPIVVQVDGAVQNPGVYTLPRDSRVQEAIQAAGGFRQDANQSPVNLAARLRDGDKLVVPAIGTPIAPLPPADEQSAPEEKNSEKAVPSAPVNLNTATLEDLQTLPGIGVTKAQQIIDYRDTHGGFKTIDELDNVNGIGPATLENLKPFITVD